MKTGVRWLGVMRLNTKEVPRNIVYIKVKGRGEGARATHS